MLKDRPHPLKKWRVDRGYSLGVAARGIGTFRQTWHDWEIQRRIPDREYMRRLYVYTAGAICPNDFYDLPDLNERALQLDAGPAPLLDRIADPKPCQSKPQPRRVQAFA